jgi:hypothetical protein
MTLFKSTAQNLVSRSQKDSTSDARATMRAIESIADDCYDYDSVDDTLSYCESFSLDSDDLL